MRNKEIVVGVGLQKSSVTSLINALKVLGYKTKQYVPEILSDYWTGPEPAVQGKEFNVKNGFNFKLFDEFTAVTDNPACFKEVYQKIYAEFPNAKFVLTVRDKDKWIDSVERHCNQQMYHRIHQNRIDNYSNYDPDKDIIFSCDNVGLVEYLYNVPYKHLDREAFARKWDSHLSEVREFFRDKPDKLIVLNVDEGSGWKDLCEFLDKPIPKIPYPHAHTYQPPYIKLLIKLGKPFPRFLKELAKKPLRKYVE